MAHRDIEPSPGDRCQLAQRPPATWSTYREQKTLERSEADSHISPLHPLPQGISVEERWKCCKSQRRLLISGKLFASTAGKMHIYLHSVIGEACKGASQAPGRENLCLEEEDMEDIAPPLAEELLAFDSY